VVTFAFFFSLVAGLNASAADRVAELMPEIILPLPENPEHLAYLGLENTAADTFSVADIDADVVLIELFSMYCPYCQKEAPLVNELYEMMNGLPESGPSVKIIGIGASNSEFEVGHFRDTYDIDFPLFPDQDLSIYKALSGAGTPGFIGIRIDPKATSEPQIVLRQSGGFHSKEEFLAELVGYAGF
jgi:peroxiredoxin